MSDPKPALPAGFTVQRDRAEPAHSQYFVLNITDDWLAREALAYLGRKYEQNNRHELSEECFGLLRATNDEFGRVVQSRQPKKK